MARVRIRPSGRRGWTVYLWQGGAWKKKTALPYRYARMLRKNAVAMSNSEVCEYIKTHRTDLLDRI